jgi:hypothetical protein
MRFVRALSPERIDFVLPEDVSVSSWGGGMYRKPSGRVVSDLRFIQCPAGQGAAERDQRFFDDLAAQFLPSRFFVEVCVVVEGGGWRGGIEVAGDGHDCVVLDGLCRLMYRRGLLYSIVDCWCCSWV